MFAHDDVIDGGPDYVLANGDELWLCNAEPDTYTEAVTTFAVGSKSAPSLSKTNGTTDGRAARVAAFTDGAISATDTASHWAIVDAGATKLLLAGALTAPQGVTSGNPFSMSAFNAYTVRDPA
jgi:hypothetical protein